MDADQIVVRVLSAEIASGYTKKSLLTGGRTEDDPCIKIRFEVRNPSANRKFDATGWTTGELSDEHGNRYLILSDDDPDRPDGVRTTLRPGQSFTDALVFQMPLVEAKTLSFEVDHKYVGSDFASRGVETLKIPMSEVADPGNLLAKP